MNRLFTQTWDHEWKSDSKNLLFIGCLHFDGSLTLRSNVSAKIIHINAKFNLVINLYCIWHILAGAFHTIILKFEVWDVKLDEFNLSKFHFRKLSKTDKKFDISSFEIGSLILII